MKSPIYRKKIGKAKTFKDIEQVFQDSGIMPPIVKTQTKTGVPVKLSLRNLKGTILITANAAHPKGDIYSSNVRWGVRGGKSGVVGYAVMPGKREKEEINMLIPKKDWDKIETEKKNFIQSELDKIKDIKPISFTFEIGADTADSWSWELPEVKKFQLTESAIIDYLNNKYGEAIKRLDFSKLDVQGETLPPRPYSYGGKKYTGEDVKTLMKALDRKVAELKKASLKEDAEKAIRQEKEKAEKNEIFKNEIIFHGVVPYQGKLLHSLAADIDEDKNMISIYTATDAKLIGNDANSTYDIKGTLSENGFKWDAEEKEWMIENTPKNQELTKKILKKYDTKAWPYDLGLRQCWECGRWAKEYELDSTGYCGC